MTRIPVGLLTGFLGSGKTTVLNHLLCRPEFCDTAVIINEVGEVGLDHVLVEQGREDVVVLEGGCICCRMKGGLNETLGNLLRRKESLDFKRVMVETSGLTDPYPVLGALIADPRFVRSFILAGVATVVDAVNFATTYAAFPEARMQVALADRLLISKGDLVDERRLREIDARLAALQPAADRVILSNAGRDARWAWIDPLASTEKTVATNTFWAGEISGGIATAALSFPGQLSYDLVNNWLDHTIELFGERLLRSKAILHLDGMIAPVVLHVVRGLAYSPGTVRAAEPDALNRVVLIAQDVPRQDLDDALIRLARTASAIPT
ncbi:MAG: GTP-binding protein [Beijerinckiaceae bacterium]